MKILTSKSDGHEDLDALVEDITDAVVTGLADYCRKSGITQIVLDCQAVLIPPSHVLLVLQ